MPSFLHLRPCDSSVSNIMRLPTQSVRQLAESVRSGDRSFADITGEAIANRRDDLGAYRHTDDDLVRSQALEADESLARGNDRGLLMGLPISAKDLYGVPGFPVHAGSPKELPAEFREAGPVIQSLQRHLAVITGKTHTVEFAFGGLGTNPHLPTPKNPWDAEHHRVPGGSSSGAGVSLCEGSAVLALGTDTAGSVRIPAAMTGKVGLKTTAGRWSLEGIVPLSPTLDTPGVLANCVDDAMVAFAAIDPSYTSVDQLESLFGPAAISDLTLGRGDRLFFDDLSAGVGEAVEDALDELANAGANVQKIEVPEVDLSYALFRQGGPVSFELHAFLSTRLPEWFDTLDPNVASRVGDAGEMADTEYQQRLADMASWSASIDQRLAEVDVLVAPTVAVTPPTVEEVATSEEYGPRNLLALRNTSIANYLGLCAITLPVGLDDAGMPVGLMLMARGGTEERLLGIARQVERVLGTGHDRLGAAPRTL